MPWTVWPALLSPLPHGAPAIGLKIMCKLAVLVLLGLANLLGSDTASAPSFEVRLETPLTSYASTMGAEVTALAVTPLEIGGQIVIPQGSRVRGRVRQAKAVGYGFIHERAMLDIEFCEYELSDGTRYPLEMRLESLDNAREQVDSRGRIKGVLAASSPQGLVRGIWFRPDASFVHRSALGLTGLGGTIWSRFSLGPAGAAGVLAARYIAFRLPEPEIRLPAGAEMLLRAIGLPENAPSFPPGPDDGVEAPLAAWLRADAQPVMRPDGRPAADPINIAFVGTFSDLRRAFRAAGWVAAEPLTLRSFSAAYRAYNSMNGYPTAPVSKLLYRQAEPDVVFQKSLNTITKRHHVRIWYGGAFEGRDVWLGAATHDTGIGFQTSSLTITHRIDPRTDGERAKVIADLGLAGCLERSSFLDRTDAGPSNGRAALTDGKLSVVWLRACADVGATPGVPHPVTGSRSKLLTRRFVLETRQYFLRDNMYYWAYRAARWKRLRSVDSKAGRAKNDPPFRKPRPTV
jgi:hypothetical protein